MLVNEMRAPVAQWIEHRTSDPSGGGSNPPGREVFQNVPSSSNRLGHRPFTPATGVRISLGAHNIMYYD